MDNIKMDFQGVGCEGMDWIGLAQGRDRWLALVNININNNNNNNKLQLGCHPVTVVILHVYKL